MQKIIEELQYVADRLVERGFAKDDRIVLVLAQAIDGLKQQSCKAGVSRRYSAQKTTNGTYAIYDAHRGVTILKSVSPQAKYNELVANHVVKLLNGG